MDFYWNKSQHWKKRLNEEFSRIVDKGIREDKAILDGLHEYDLELHICEDSEEGRCPFHRGRRSFCEFLRTVLK